MPPQRVVIKKYENRRLYDTANSRYVNLEDIAQMLRDGADVQVIDAASGEDLTRVVLTQIIVENARTPNSALPLDLLRHMVISSGNAGKEGVLNYMRRMMELYQNTYRAFAPPLSPFDLFQSESSPQPAPSAETLAPQPPDRPAVEDLQRRIEELERLVAANQAATRKVSRVAKTKLRSRKRPGHA